MLTDSVFRETGLDVFLDGLKCSQGNSVSAETMALVANSVEMAGLSVNRLDRLLENDVVRAEYGLDATAPRSVYRTSDHSSGTRHNGSRPHRGDPGRLQEEPPGWTYRGDSA